MDMKKVAAASVFALALVACIALFNGNAVEDIKYFGSSLGSYKKPSIASSPSAPAKSGSSFSSIFGSDKVWDEEEDTPVPDQSALHGLSNLLSAQSKPQSDFHETYSYSAPAHKAAAPKKAYKPKKVSWSSLFTSTKTHVSHAASGGLNRGDSVKVQYKLRLASTGKEVFRQWGTGQGGTFSFVLGGGHVIPGFDRVISGMKVNEQRTGVHIAASEAYGAKGMAAANIPPNADLVYDLKVVGKN